MSELRDAMLHTIASLDRLASKHVIETGKVIKLLGEGPHKQYTDEVKRCAAQWELAATGLAFWTDRLIEAETIIIPALKQTGEDSTGTK